MPDDSDGFVGLLLGSGVIVFFGWIIDRAVLFGARLILARGFGKVDYGAISLGATMLAMGSTFALLGLHVGVSRYLPRNDSPTFKRGVILSAIQVVLPASLLVGGLTVFFAEPLAVTFLDGAEQAPLLRVFGFGIPFATTVKLAINVVRGQQHSDAKVVIENVAIPVCQFAGIGLAFVGAFGPVAVAWAYTASYVAATVLALYYVRKHTPLFESVGSTRLRRELLSFSLPLLFTSVMFMLLTDIDTMMLGYFDTPTAVAEYNVAYPLSFLLLAVLESFSFLFVPVLSQLHADNQQGRMRSVYQLLTKWVIFLTTPLFLLAVSYSHEIIALTFGEAYVASATALVVLSIGFFFRAVVGPSGSTLTAIGRTSLHVYDTAGVTALNIVLNLLLIPRFSYLGAAVATTVCYVVLNILYASQVYLETGIVPVSRRTLRPLAGLTIVSVAAYAISGVPTALWQYLVLFVGYGVAVLAVIALLGGITDDELVLLENVEERLSLDLTAVKRILE